MLYFYIYFCYFEYYFFLSNFELTLFTNACLVVLFPQNKINQPPSHVNLKLHFIYIECLSHRIIYIYVIAYIIYTKL